MSSGHGMTPCIGSGSCKNSLPPVSHKWKSRRDTCGRAITSSTWHLSQFNATMRRGFDFRLLPLEILVTRECEIENIFPHLSTRRSKEQLWPAWNIKLLAKTWNRRKFLTRVTSKVYCSMYNTSWKLQLISSFHWLMFHVGKKSKIRQEKCFQLSTCNCDG
jgi:hypothetical protein